MKKLYGLGLERVDLKFGGADGSFHTGFNNQAAHHFPCLAFSKQCI